MKMTVSELINKRASCRYYANKDVPEELLNYIIDNGLKTPSASNLQAYSIVNIIDREKRKKLAELSGQSVVEKAPVLLLFCIDLRRIKRISERYPCPLCNADNFIDFWMCLLDVGMCMQNTAIVAESKGLGTVCIGNPISYMSRVSDLVELPELVCPVLLMCMGYSAQKKKPMPKYDRKVVLHTDTYEDLPMELLELSFQEHFRGWKKNVSENELEEFKETCTSWKDSRYADFAANNIRKAGGFNYYQYFLGIIYKLKSDIMNNKDYKSYFRNQGFGWFE